MRYRGSFMHSLVMLQQETEGKRRTGLWRTTRGCLAEVLKAGRWRISLAAAFAATSGALLRRPTWDRHTFAVFMGVLLFALACTWINQYQERKQDFRMVRTRGRPLANHGIPVRYALSFTALCLIASLPLLYACGGWQAIGLLATVLILYNGMYTTLKERSLLALFPGAVGGAVPPVLGWICAGGVLSDPAPLALFLLFFLWQVPHFWLAAERFTSDYENAGVPVPWRLFGRRRYVQILTLWVAAFCIGLLAFPAFGLVHSGVAQIIVLFIGIGLLIGLCFPSLRPHRLFQAINLCMAAMCILLVAEKVYRG